MNSIELLWITLATLIDHLGFCSPHLLAPVWPKAAWRCHVQPHRIATRLCGRRVSRSPRWSYGDSLDVPLFCPATIENYSDAVSRAQHKQNHWEEHPKSLHSHRWCEAFHLHQLCRCADPAPGGRRILHSTNRGDKRGPQGTHCRDGMELQWKFGTGSQFSQLQVANHRPACWHQDTRIENRQHSHQIPWPAAETPVRPKINASHPPKMEQVVTGKQPQSFQGLLEEVPNRIPKVETRCDSSQTLLLLSKPLRWPLT